MANMMLKEEIAF